MSTNSKKIFIAIAVSLAIFVLMLILIFFMPKKSGNITENTAEETDQPIPLPPPSYSSEWEKKKQENKFESHKTEKDSYDFLEENPKIVSQAKKLMPGFSISKMAVSTPVVNIKLSDNHEVLLLFGCEEHNCGGTGIVIAYDKTNNKLYLLTEETESVEEEYRILGNPEEEIKNLLIDYYKNG